MKPKYECPQCLELFSRNWNMREHCRTQHNYDPEPNRKPLPIGQRKSGEMMNSATSSSVEKFLKMMANSRFQQTGMRDSAGEPLPNSMDSVENALDYLLENFVLVMKKEFQGISGYFCPECLEFQYRYIKNYWDDRTAESEHSHTYILSSDVKRSGMGRERRMQANNLLLELTNSLFPGDKKFKHYAPGPRENFRGPVFKFKMLSPYHWAGAAISCLEHKPVITDFIVNVQGTYALIIVESGDLRGTYMIAVQNNV